MRFIISTVLAAVALSACTWEMYQNESGSTRLRQKYPTGSSVYYTEGAASQSPYHHSHRPVQHVVLPE